MQLVAVWVGVANHTCASVASCAQRQVVMLSACRPSAVGEGACEGAAGQTASEKAYTK